MMFGSSCALVKHRSLSPIVDVILALDVAMGEKAEVRGEQFHGRLAKSQRNASGSSFCQGSISCPPW